MSKKKPPPPNTSPGALTHNPFATLAGKSELMATSAKAEFAPMNPQLAPETKLPPIRPPPRPKLSLRLETTGRSGKVVTRIKGLPPGNLEAIGGRLRKALGCGASVDGGDLLLLGTLLDRASQWLEQAGDLHAIVAEPGPVGTPKPQSPLPQSLVQDTVGQMSATVHRNVRRGQRVAIVTKANQASGALTEGLVDELLTSSATHPRGIKVRLQSGEIGRVRRILG
jgi:uncharacterized repeat protein (TIGR03833 family)